MNGIRRREIEPESLIRRKRFGRRNFFMERAVHLLRSILQRRKLQRQSCPVCEFENAVPEVKLFRETDGGSQGLSVPFQNGFGEEGAGGDEAGLHGEGERTDFPRIQRDFPSGNWEKFRRFNGKLRRLNGFARIEKFHFPQIPFLNGVDDGESAVPVFPVNGNVLGRFAAEADPFPLSGEQIEPVVFRITVFRAGEK